MATTKTMQSCERNFLSLPKVPLVKHDQVSWKLDKIQHNGTTKLVVAINKFEISAPTITSVMPKIITEFNPKSNNCA